MLTDSDMLERLRGTAAQSAADLAHRPPGAHEVDVPDAMAGPLRADSARDGVGEPIVEVARVETVFGPEQAAQIGFVECEQAGAELAFGGEPHAVAVIAERFGHARDHADVADAVAVGEALGGPDMVVKAALDAARKIEREDGADALDDRVGRRNPVAPPLPWR